MGKGSLYWRRIFRNATLITVAYSCLIAFDFLVIYPLQLWGVLDDVAALCNAIAFSSCYPGYIVARIIDLDSESVRDPAFVAAGPAFTAAMVWFGAAILLALHSLFGRGRADRGEASPLPASTESDVREDRAAQGRRRFVKGVGATIAGGLALPALYPVVIEPRWPRYVRLHFPIHDLPASLEGLRIVHLTDLHLGPYVSCSYLSEVVEECNETEPDLFLLTGDYIYNSSTFLPRAVEVLRRLRSRFGSIAVLGNHDCFDGGAQSREALRDAGIHLVNNGKVWVTGSGQIVAEAPQAPSLCVAGVGDFWVDTPDIEAALAGVDPQTPRILLSHNPDFAETREAREGGHRVDLMLSGHTHGGQISLPYVPALFNASYFGDTYTRGLVQGPAFPVYISVGVGVGSLPARFRVRPEVTVIELSRHTESP
jgi:hypothetical protein